MSSVVIRSVDRELVTTAVMSYVAQLRREHPEVEQVFWFGSWTGGIPMPGSDVDLCLILSSSEKPHRERICDYLPVGFPVGLDLFPYTREEFDRLRETSPQWHAVLSGGRALLPQSIGS